MRKLSGRAGQVDDEQWTCYAVIEEQKIGWKGPRSHRGWVYDVGYVLRSSEHKQALEIERGVLENDISRLTGTGKLNEANSLMERFGQRWTGAKPGDHVVDRNFRRVYLIDKDGARRTVTDHEETQSLIAEVRRQLESARKGINDQTQARQPVDAGNGRDGEGSSDRSNPVSEIHPVAA